MRIRKHVSKQRKNVYAVDHESTSSSNDITEDSIFIDTLETLKGLEEKEWLVELKVEEDKMIIFKLDKGAYCNVISTSDLKSIKNVKLQRSRMHLITY